MAIQKIRKMKNKIVNIYPKSRLILSPNWPFGRNWVYLCLKSNSFWYARFVTAHTKRFVLTKLKDFSYHTHTKIIRDSSPEYSLCFSNHRVTSITFSRKFDERIQISIKYFRVVTAFFYELFCLFLLFFKKSEYFWSLAFHVTFSSFLIHSHRLSHSYVSPTQTQRLFTHLIVAKER